MTFIGLIPARYASTRFPGKPLVDIAGKPMIQRVYEQASQVLDHVCVATDDKRIEDAVKAFGGNVVMTSDQHRSGTDRCKEAYQKVVAEKGQDFDVVINIQGDEPFINPEQIKSLMDCFSPRKDTLASRMQSEESFAKISTNEEIVDIATLVKEIKSEDDLFDVNKVKVVKAISGKALYFSRQTIPYQRDVEKSDWLSKHKYFKHIGMYAYKTDVLMDIADMKPGELEKCENLEQLRWLENDLTIMTAETDYESVGIDTPEDLEKIDWSKL